MSYSQHISKQNVNCVAIQFALDHHDTRLKWRVTPQGSVAAALHQEADSEVEESIDVVQEQEGQEEDVESFFDDWDQEAEDLEEYLEQEDSESDAWSGRTVKLEADRESVVDESDVVQELEEAEAYAAHVKLGLGSRASLVNT